ncbi:MAG TPA: DUF1508 domain-containing protein [Flavobacterium sp.]|nr:DUF1508 domain-containing protein [Flavobacterium sp.]
MGVFLITKRFDGSYKFAFTSRNGKTIFTSIRYELKEECEKGIDIVKNAIQNYGCINFKSANGKYFFKIVSDNHVLATSRKFSTELLLQNGKDEIHRVAFAAETLDFSVENFVFSDVEVI